MRKKYAILIVIALTIRAITYGQEATTDISLRPVAQDTAYNKYLLPSISAGAGILTFFGDIGNYSDRIHQVGRFNSTAAFIVEQRFGGAFGVSLSGLKGSLCENDDRSDRHLNFQSDVLQANLSINFHFDNGFIFNKTSRFSAYLTAGFGYMTFLARGDLRDKNNAYYNYWPDGTIRDCEYDWENPQNGNIVKRDYKFETLLDSLNLYHHHAFTLPIGGGLNFKLSDKFEAYISSVYFFTNSDVIDNYSCQNSSNNPFFSKYNDNYLFTSVTLQYNLSGMPKDKLDSRHYKDINFEALYEMDSDKDKVKDSEDKCPGTPKGVKVDKDGCPIDRDKDGVPDYIDKELNTPLGKLVDENGVTLTPQMLEAKYLRDSLIINGLLVFDKDSTMTVSDANDSIIRQRTRAYYNSLKSKNITNEQLVAIGNQNNNQANQNQNNTVVINNTQVTNNVNQIKVTPSASGVIYRVQIGSVGSNDSKSYFQKTYNINEEIYIDAYQGTYKYSIGNFSTYAVARQYANDIGAKTGITGFVISFKNGVRIPVADARVITGE